MPAIKPARATSPSRPTAPQSTPPATASTGGGTPPGRGRRLRRRQRSGDRHFRRIRHRVHPPRRRTSHGISVRNFSDNGTSEDVGRHRRKRTAPSPRRTSAATGSMPGAPGPAKFSIDLEDVTIHSEATDASEVLGTSSHGVVALKLPETSGGSGRQQQHRRPAHRD